DEWLVRHPGWHTSGNRRVVQPLFGPGRCGAPGVRLCPGSLCSTGPDAFEWSGTLYSDAGCGHPTPPHRLRPAMLRGHSGLLGHKLRGGAFAHGRGAVPGTFSEPRRLCLAPAGEREQFRKWATLQDLHRPRWPLARLPGRRQWTGS
ncbi:unnamed protein product, partial [Durusdinium trenchii]